MVEQRGHLRRERRRAIIQSFEAQAQAHPQVTQYLLGELGKSQDSIMIESHANARSESAGHDRSAFSRRNPLFLIPNPVHTEGRTEDTSSTNPETTETESILTQTEYLRSSETTSGSPSPLEEVEKNSQPSPDLSTSQAPFSYFTCIHCSIPRRSVLEYLGICIYCLQHEQKVCLRGQHELDRSDFIDEEGDEHASCNVCRKGETFGDEEVDDTEGSSSSEGE